MSPLITIASSGMYQGVHYIFCPFAGGGSGSLRAWRNLNLVKESVSVMLYPGRETRIDDATIENIESLAEEMIQALLASRIPIEKTIIVGHSMGAQVAYEASRKLVHQGHTPKGLVISGCQAPHIKGRRLLSKCDDTTFIANLIEMGGCDQSLADNPQWWSIFLPALRADFTATEQYFFASPPNRDARLSVPTILVSGDKDQEAYYSEVEEWKFWCNDVIEHLVVKGGHFYVTEHPEMMLECVRALSSEVAEQ